MIVGHVLTVTTWSFMYTNQKDMIAHTLAFLRVGEHSPSSELPSCKQRMAGIYFSFETFLPKLFLMVRFEPGTFHSASDRLSTENL